MNWVCFRSSDYSSKHVILNSLREDYRCKVSLLSFSLNSSAPFRLLIQRTENGKLTSTYQTVAVLARQVFILKFFYSVSVSLSTLDKPVSKLAMPAGSSTVLSTVFSPTARCPLTRLSAAETTHSTPSSARLELESTSQELFLLIWSLL